MKPHRLACTLAGAAALALSACTVHTAPATYGPAPAEATVTVEGEPSEPGEPGAVVPTPGLRAHPPVSCVGSEDIELRGVFIDAPEDAIVIAGSCNVVIIDSHIAAANAAISIAGSGDVVLHNSVVEGGRSAISIAGSGEVRAQGTRFIGGQAIAGSGGFVDEGGNSWE